jgi:hypothetical protein
MLGGVRKRLIHSGSVCVCVCVHWERLIVVAESGKRNLTLNFVSPDGIACIPMDTP